MRYAVAWSVLLLMACRSPVEPVVPPTDSCVYRDTIVTREGWPAVFVGYYSGQACLDAYRDFPLNTSPS